MHSHCTVNPNHPSYKSRLVSQTANHFANFYSFLSINAEKQSKVVNRHQERHLLCQDSKPEHSYSLGVRIQISRDTNFDFITHALPKILLITEDAKNAQTKQKGTASKNV